MWIHIFVQMFAYGVIFPIGMVLGVSRLLCCRVLGECF